MSRRTYVDNAYNRSIGRVGMTLGSASVSRSSSSQSGSFDRCYVENAQNRGLGRVGLELGTAVHSRSSLGSSQHSSTSEGRTYADNAQNRSLGRVGLELGTAVHSRSSSKQILSNSPRTYADNAYNRRLERVGLPLRSAVHSSSVMMGQSNVSCKQRTYVDNAHNRKLGRVGLPLGSAVERTEGNPTKGNWKSLQKLLIDHDEQAHNRDTLWDYLANGRTAEPNCDQLEGILNRRDAAKVHRTRPAKSSINFDGHVIDFAELELGDKIGIGGFADVHIAIWKKEYQVAVKRLRMQRVSQNRKTEFENEAQLLSTLKHPAIITLYGACIETPNLALVMEFMPKGSLHDLLLESIQLSDVQKLSLIHDCLSALQYIHARRITHRDIKSRNILVCESLANCKLSDFGLALKDYSETSSSVTAASANSYNFVGTIKYSPPEVLAGNRLTVEDLMAADIYSMALTIVELISEEEPFDGLNQNQVRKAVLAGETPSIDDVPVEFRKLIGKCMGEARYRPSATKFLENYLKVKDAMWNENLE